MKPLRLVLLAACCCSVSAAQHANSNFATLAVNESASDAVGQGPVEAEVFTQSDLTLRLRGMPQQGIMVLHGDYEPGSLALDDFFQIDLALAGIGVLADGLTVPSLDLMTDSTGDFAQTRAFPGRADQEDFLLDLQCIIANPFSAFGVSSTAVGRIQVRAGYQEHLLGDDDFVMVPFREGMTFDFYGETYDRVWVTSNGRITFDSPRDVTALFTDAFHQGPPQIAGMYHDFNPQALAATTISTSQYKVGEEWYFRISYDTVQETFNPGVFFDFDVTLMPFGAVQIAIGGHLIPPLGATVVGLSPGNFLPSGFLGSRSHLAPMDLSAAVGTFTYAGDGQPAFEHFHDSAFPFAPLPPFDLPSTTVTFYPAHSPGAGVAGYNVN